MQNNYNLITLKCLDANVLDVWILFYENYTRRNKYAAIAISDLIDFTLKMFHVSIQALTTKIDVIILAIFDK